MSYAKSTKDLLSDVYKTHIELDLTELRHRTSKPNLKCIVILRSCKELEPNQAMTVRVISHLKPWHSKTTTSTSGRKYWQRHQEQKQAWLNRTVPEVSFSLQCRSQLKSNNFYKSSPEHIFGCILNLWTSHSQKFHLGFDGHVAVRPA